MDIYCRHCREPWDNDSLHEEAEARGSTYAKVAADFRENGCSALRLAFGVGACCGDRDGGEVVGAVYDLLGDDMDGAASMLEDAEMMGLI